MRLGNRHRLGQGVSEEVQLRNEEEGIEGLIVLGPKPARQRVQGVLVHISALRGELKSGWRGDEGRTGPAHWFLWGAASRGGRLTGRSSRAARLLSRLIAGLAFVRGRGARLAVCHVEDGSPV